MNREEKNRLINAVKMWCLCRGFEEAENSDCTADLVFKTENKTIGFILCDEENDDSFSPKTECDLTYAVISDPEKRSAVQQRIPDTWGILFYGNPYGLGYMYQLYREAKPL